MSETHIPGFEILALIGRGGMASVWKARQISLDRLVAIKILSSHFGHTTADIDRFQQEAKVAARLKHPGIVQVYDAGNQNGAYYFVMEFVAGYTVGEWLRRKGQLPESEALTVAECVADALDYAWTQAAMVHCDIKPDNVIIDADGSVKVADLGLSRTIKAMTREVGAGQEILGTPAYISPEQAMADPGLDCRSDIYSLGAMLFHLLTGRRLFHGQPDEQVIELQCTSQDENPGQVAPALSKGVCAMVERMLAKDPQFRQPDWKAVKQDLARVKTGHLPGQFLPGHAISTVKRTPLTRLQTGPDAAHSALRRWQQADRSTPLMLGLKIGAAVIGCTIAVVIGANRGAFHHRLAPPPVAPPPPSTPTTTTTTTTVTLPPSVSPAEAARREFDAVRRWISENPGQPREGLRRMQRVGAAGGGQALSELVQEETRKLRAAIRQQTGAVMAELSVTCAPLVREGKFKEAAEVYATYAGPGAPESAPERQAMAQDLRRRAQERAGAKPPTPAPAADSVRRVLTEAVDEALAGRIQAAAVAVAAAVRQAGVAVPGALRDAERLLQEAAGLDARVMQSFESSSGQDVAVQFVSGPQTLTVQHVSATQVVAVCRVVSGSGSASRRVAFGIEDLSVRERLARLGDEEQPDVALVKGCLAYRARALPHARRYFGRVPAPLGPMLLERVDAEAAPPPAAPRAAEPEAPQAATEPSVVPRAQSALTKNLQAVKDDIDGVTDLMLRRNPKLNASLFDVSANASGQAESVVIGSGSVMDLSPLAALTALKAVTYRPTDWRESGALKDLSGLGGLQLTRLAVVNSRVTDLTPLRGMPLVSASFADSPVRDLSPLRGMPLQSLDIRRTGVIDITPLADLPLRELHLDGAAIRRVQVLKGLPLVDLSAAESPMQDFTWLQDCRNLVQLNLAGTAIRSIQALAGMPLKGLDLSGTPVTDISSLSGMKLRRLRLGNTGVKDFSVIKGMPLEDLDVEGSTFSDVGLLSGMPLRSLNLSRSGVRDLWAIEGMGLTTLSLQKLNVPDLTPLAKVPLVSLDLRGCASLNTQPLQGLKIERIWIDTPERHRIFIRSLRALRYLNGVDLFYATDSPFRRSPPADG